MTWVMVPWVPAAMWVAPEKVESDCGGPAGGRDASWAAGPAAPSPACGGVAIVAAEIRPGRAEKRSKNAPASPAGGAARAAGGTGRGWGEEGSVRALGRGPERLVKRGGRLPIEPDDERPEPAVGVLEHQGQPRVDDRGPVGVGGAVGGHGEPVQLTAVEAESPVVAGVVGDRADDRVGALSRQGFGLAHDSGDLPEQVAGGAAA